MNIPGDTTFELHDVSYAASEPFPQFSVAPAKAAPGDTVLVIDHEGPTWIGFADEFGPPQRVSDAANAVFGVQVVRRKLTSELALAPLRPGVLVNSIPALKLTLLGTRDSLSAGAGRLIYVTKRFRPHVGPPTEEMIAARLKCPFCKLAVAADTVVVSCRCGVLYHRESEDSHPQLPAEDRLNCQAKISTCLSCGQLVSLAESLVWDPATL
jgi:hypothetical protein